MRKMRPGDIIELEQDGVKVQMEYVIGWNLTTLFGFNVPSGTELSKENQILLSDDNLLVAKFNTDDDGNLCIEFESDKLIDPKVVPTDGGKKI